MGRLRFKVGEQKRFIETVTKYVSCEDLAKKYGISARTIRDWRREKFHANAEIMNLVSKDFSVPLPAHKVLPSGWHLPAAGVLGGGMRMSKYGPPGTDEGKKKGGRISQERRRTDPERYRELGCIVRKTFEPLIPSEKLAELFGILLGDGGITQYQIRISLDRVADVEYEKYVELLMQQTLKVVPRLLMRKSVVDLMVSGVNLIENLEELGLLRGNKVEHQVEIPKWIMCDEHYQRACLRGLFDTDGGIYIHRKRNGNYIGWCFSSSSKPLMQGVCAILASNGFKYSVSYGKKVYMYKTSDILRYMNLFGSGNPKNWSRIRSTGRG